jgi:hypothetical protein
MAQFALGTRPVGFAVILVKGSIFRCKLRNTKWAWPSGAQLKLVFNNGESWDATLTDDTASWTKDVAQVEAASSATTVQLIYVTADGPTRWASGKVEVVE